VELAKYQYIGKNCQICDEIIKFADFCIECNVRFCPDCDAQNDPYSDQCLCGFIFTPLEIEFALWSGSNEVVFEEKHDKKEKS
jgi:hypothetical protein